ncbi:MAG: transglycosylase SLT domain-containing protein [Rikenellaceae bacterium]
MNKLNIFLVAFLTIATIPTTIASGEKLSWREKRELAKEERAEEHKKSKNSHGGKVTPPPVEESEAVVSESSEEVEPKEFDSVAYRKSLTLDFTIDQIDSLLAVWRERSKMDQYSNFFENFIAIPTEGDVEVDISSIPDSVLSRRLMDLVSPINLPYNSIVKSYISRYINTRYGTINRIMSLSQYYFPMVEEELINHGLPVELRAMPVIESALSSTAVSKAGAVGLWQFMPSTGKSYGLEINSLVDERCHPEEATKAACAFMSDLYDIYNDWSLAIAAYNCGPGNVNKALARAGIKEGGTFWDIYYYLPRETRGYVPAFIGATYAYAYHKLHGVEFLESPLPLATDTIQVNKLMHLGQVAETLEIPIEVLRDLNPQYRKDIIPATTKEYSLRLPQRYVTKYIENEAEIHAKDSTYLKQYIDPVVVKKAQSDMGNTIHTVRSGETLGAIARKYRVTVRQIMNWNGLRNADKLSVGQRLRIEGR